jgi:hypothetical protein
MPYYPSSQIKPNLYTSGGEFTLFPNQNTSPPLYTGYYYETSNGSFYTGKTPSDGPNRRLFKVQPLQYDEAYPDDTSPEFPNLIIYNQFSDETYRTLQQVDLSSSRKLPQPCITEPTVQELELRVYTRYFCKKNNELKYMEIDKLTFNKLSSKSKDIAWDLYTPLSTLWYLFSPDINKNLITQIEREQKWYGFTQYFKDKFY